MSGVLRYKRSAMYMLTYDMDLGSGPLGACQYWTEDWLDSLTAAVPERCFSQLGSLDFGPAGGRRRWRLCQRIQRAAGRPDNRRILYWWRGYGGWPNAY